MIRGLRGSLLSREALAAAGFSTVALSAEFEHARRAAAACHAAISRDGGPAWNARLVFDRVPPHRAGAAPQEREQSADFGLRRREHSLR